MKTQKSSTNLAVKLPRDVDRKARILAAERETSISALVASLIEGTVQQRDGYEQAKRRAIARMRKGYNLGFTPVPRDELHERG